ncbi:MAG: cation transporter [Rhizobiaceae bacterium]|nr:cation transporter [Rhizobiaceae bacterium]
MRTISAHEFPPDIDRLYRRARTFEWITVGYILTSVAFLYVAMGSSQAMRTSFFEDAVSIIPAIAFLVCTKLARRRPTPDYPYGMHRATSIGHLVAALALTCMGLFLLGEGSYKLLTQEKASVGTMTLFGFTFWAGWLMLAALVYTALPSFFLGRMKAKLAPQLHDKILHADAGMMKADWMSEVAAAVGVAGLGFGIWWLDPAAAIVVSLSIMKDGATNLISAVTDLADRRPRNTDGSEWDPLPYEVRDLLQNLDWVDGAEVRMREEGHVFMGEAFVVPKAGTKDLVELIGRASEKAKALDWRLHEIVINPVSHLSAVSGSASVQRASTQD